MSEFVEISAAELEGNYFKRIGQDWMLIAAEKEGKVNAMTASWGGVGVYWNKPCAYTVVRPQRYTKGFIDHAGAFSLTFFPEGFRDELNLMGTKSGRELDKVKACGFDVLYADGVPYFAQADTAIICKPLVAQAMEESALLHPELSQSVYPNKDFHILYISEITKILVRK